MIRSKGTMPLEMGLRAINEAADIGIRSYLLHRWRTSHISPFETLIKEASA